jgi:hypothetical protein
VRFRGGEWIGGFFRKVKGRREGVGGAIEEGVVDDTTERQSEVARPNVVKAGI